MESFSIEIKTDDKNFSQLEICKKRFATGAAAITEIRKELLPLIFQQNLNVSAIDVIDNDFQERYAHIDPEKEKKFVKKYACQDHLREMLAAIMDKVDGDWSTNNILQDLIDAEKFISDNIYEEGIFY